MICENLKKNRGLSCNLNSFFSLCNQFDAIGVKKGKTQYIVSVYYFLILYIVDCL